MGWQIFLNEFACGYFEIRRSVETPSVELPNSGPSVKMSLQVLSGRCKKCPGKIARASSSATAAGTPWPPASACGAASSSSRGEDKDKNHSHQHPKYLAVPLLEPCDRDCCDKKIRLREIQPLSASKVRELEAKDYSRWAPVIPPRTC
ncbi:hypothetical protein PG994_004799 [Apiospora phragmitis]|uniref:Uncharacterized protein n=1 Tax=Apiospora phragmitis TaxID=2905665 RepID=A0ABR1VRL6_9PEZI